MLFSILTGKNKWYNNLLRTVICLAVATTLSAVLMWTRDMGSASLLYVLAVFIISAITDGYVWGIAASVVGVIGVNYFFIEPFFALNLLTPGYTITCIIMLIISVLTSALTTRLKRHNQLVVDIEKEKMSNHLLRSISHDLRTPLTSIIGSSSIMLETDPPLNRHTEKELLKDINEEAQWLLRMVENLLTVTRIGEDSGVLRTQPEVVEEVLAEAVSRVKSRFPGQPIESHVPDELLIVPMDATLVEQVIINLVENAIKHSGRPIRVQVSIYPKDSWAVFEIKDNGNGMTREELDNLFLPYGMKPQEGDSSRNHGLGLPICRSIIKAHGGNLTVESEPGKGTMFRFRLPLGNQD